jgi:ABC-type uncharacterized transport system permease subunit|eukprot:CAMPEP_0174296746 /NCGR_PEP_ID=MMETSP0809-20121228/48843_1 /TAXON_ID=73025 ORGANISM="Eutreptiella gymnastica-like, Strain CCMP1594" /NCGR_SAMPLE_ID=MMETSP0809 /ASSEMBLY_ACC=CAM_ASM_000658 /LENGTH=57 /DNA_ID=CAMNT_0015399977 /DNA_START=103 /DNA_END=276 /DNA_ORIENTATION=-
MGHKVGKSGKFSMKTIFNHLALPIHSDYILRPTLQVVTVVQQQQLLYFLPKSEVGGE